MQQALKAMTFEAVEAAILARGLERFRSDQIVDWIYDKGVSSFAEMTNLPVELRRRLEGFFHLTPSRETAHQVSRRDGTRKFLLEFEDGQSVETVLMLRSGHSTVCISSQVGCRFACKFCVTARKGLQRNLAADEIVQQVLHARKYSHHPGLNVVFMGMGEPLDNFEAVVTATRILTDDKLVGLGSRRITISTTGVVERIRQLADLSLGVRLAISLNASQDSDRKFLMPVSGRHTIAETLAAARYYARRSKHQVTLEYVLLRDTTDRDEDLERLKQLAGRQAPFKLNLIPFNPDPRIRYRRPESDRVKHFEHELKQSFRSVTVRWSQGLDIDAACGQLFGKKNASAA